MFYDLDLTIKIPCENVVMSVYFNSNPDPQRGNYIEKDNFEYIKPWYESVIKNKLNGILFHDNLSDDFLKKYESEYVKFIFIDPKYLVIRNYYSKVLFDKKKIKYYSDKPVGVRLKRRASINDFRFSVYYNFLRQNKDIKKVFLTDVCDLEFLTNFFDNVEDKIIYCGEQKKYTVIGSCKCSKRANGSVKHKNGNFISCGWNKTEVYKKFIPVKYVDEIKRFGDNVLLAAGIIGGSYDVILAVLEEMVRSFSYISTIRNINMFVFNYSVYYVSNKYNYKLITGFPVHTVLSGEKTYDDKGCWIKHRKV